MRFLREMIVRKTAGAAPTEGRPDEPPVQDFFELSPMRDRMARRRAAEGDEADSAALPPGDAVADADAVAAGVADRMRPRRPVPVARPRADLVRPAGDGFDDLELGEMDDDDLDDADLDGAADRAIAPAAPAPAAPRHRPVPGARAGHASGADRADPDDDTLDDDGDAAADLTDDPALAALIAARRPAAAPPALAQDDDAPPAADLPDDSAILASIAAALPPVRPPVAAAPVAAAPMAAPVATPVPAPIAAPVAAPVASAPVAAAPTPMAPALATSPASVPPVAAHADPRQASVDTPAAPPRTPRIWDLPVDAGSAAPAAVAMHAPGPAPGPVPDPVPGPQAAPDAARRGGRVRTRLLGFNAADDLVPDPVRAAAAAAAGTAHPADRVAAPGHPGTHRAGAAPAQFPVGWLVVIDGPGRGAAFTLGAGVSSIGRQDDQVIQLDFGDTAISRQMHAAIAYDPESRGFFLGQGGKSNIVRLNGRPVLSTEDLKDGDVIRIGETTLKLVAFCGRAFDWSDAPAAAPTVAHPDARA